MTATRASETSLRTAIEARLTELATSPAGTPALLGEAIRYSLLAPGKRVRPMITLLSAAYCGGHWQPALDPACAIEMVHTASLILDDLPAMDDAALRRGLPTVHLRFGEDAAVLAAVALMNQAFAVLAAAPLAAELRLELVAQLAFVIGPAGVTAGQARDLRERTSSADLSSLEEINRQKTGMLFTLAAETGARIAGADQRQLIAVRDFASAAGAAFQARDDLLDRTASSSELGKNTYQDTGKANLLDLMGEPALRSAILRHCERALSALADGAGRDDGLRDYALRLFNPAPPRAGQHEQQPRYNP